MLETHEYRLLSVDERLALLVFLCNQVCGWHGVW